MPKNRDSNFQLTTSLTLPSSDSLATGFNTQLMTSFLLPSRATFFAMLFTLLATICTQPVCAKTEHGVTGSEIEIGFAGHTRLGAWFPIFVQANDSESATSYSIETVDADGFPVTLQGQPIQHADGWLECLMQAGRKHHECQVQLSSDQGAIVTHAFRLNNSLAGRVIHPSTQGLTVVIEPGDSIASSIAAQSSGSRTSESAIVSISTSDHLPSNWMAWQSVERLVIAASASDQLTSMSPAQWSAIETWVERGGDLIVSVGPGHTQFLSDEGPLRAFCPGKHAGVAEVESSSRIEFFANANEQLIARGGRPINVCRLEEVQGRVELTQDALPLIVSTAFGFGELTFVAFDLSDSRLTNWKGFSGLLQRIQDGVNANDTAAGRSRGNAQGNRVSHVGYTDLAGQLRLTLDRFSSVTFVSFATIASLIGLFILCVGPGDYFLLRKLAGRMEFTWLTFPMISLVFCTVAFLLAKSVRPANIKLNQLEIVDIDQATGQARSNIWTHYYSPVGGQCSIDLPGSTALTGPIQQRLISWQGLPGDGLGGMNTRAVNSLSGQSHLQQIGASSDQSLLHIHIADQPLRVSSTRALFSQWWGESKSPLKSDLRLNRRTRHIEGTFSNPLNRPLKECRLLFGEYVYQLPARLEPGDEIDILGDDLREQTTRSYLNRRSKDSEDANRARKIPWDPTSTRIDRLAEIMMFYSAAGGHEYTGLSHGYQPFADLTDHLQLSRAILVGKVDSLITPLQIDDQSAEDSYDSTSTFVRLIFPVETR